MEISEPPPTRKKLSQNKRRTEQRRRAFEEQKKNPGLYVPIPVGRQRKKKKMCGSSLLEPTWVSERSSENSEPAPGISLHVPDIPSLDREIAPTLLVPEIPSPDREIALKLLVPEIPSPNQESPLNLPRSWKFYSGSGDLRTGRGPAPTRRGLYVREALQLKGGLAKDSTHRRRGLPQSTSLSSSGLTSVAT